MHSKGSQCKIKRNKIINKPYNKSKHISLEQNKPPMFKIDLSCSKQTFDVQNKPSNHTYQPIINKSNIFLTLQQLWGI
jgi:hypothetical protein